MATQSRGSRTTGSSTSGTQAGESGTSSRTGTGEASGLANQLRSKASSSLSQQKERATQGLGTVVEAVRGTGRQLRENNQSAVAGYIDNAADSMQRWTETLQRKDVGEILEDVQRFGRRQPALFIGLSFGAGLLGARFLKSSRPFGTDSAYRSAPAAYDDRDSYTAARSTGVRRDARYGASGTQTDFS